MTRWIKIDVYKRQGEGESTTDLVFGGHNIIAENGSVLAESKRFENGIIYSEIDVNRLMSERRKNTTFKTAKERTLTRVPFDIEITETELTRVFPSRPFVPSENRERAKRCEEILTIQAMGLKKRLEHTHAKCAVVGISGGLDSTCLLYTSFAATFGVGMYSNIDMISSLCVLMARGAIISMIVVVFILPSMFMVFDKVIVKTSKGFLPQSGDDNKKNKNNNDNSNDALTDGAQA